MSSSRTGPRESARTCSASQALCGTGTVVRRVQRGSRAVFWNTRAGTPFTMRRASVIGRQCSMTAVTVKTSVGSK